MGNDATQRSVEHRSPMGDQAVRPTHLLEAPLQCFDLDEEIGTLRREPPFVQRDRNAKTLVKSGAFRVVLVVLKAGATFDEDDPRGHMSMLVRDGQVSLEVGPDRTTVGTGQIAAIARGHPWRARADRDSVAILHFSWPG